MPFLKHSCFFFLPVIMSNISLITLIFSIFYFFILPNSENKNCPRSCICLIIILTAFFGVILSITMASVFTGPSHLDIPLPPMSHSIQVNIYTLYCSPYGFPTFITPASCQFKTVELILASLSLFSPHTQVFSCSCLILLFHSHHHHFNLCPSLLLFRL